MTSRILPLHPRLSRGKGFGKSLKKGGVTINSRYAIAEHTLLGFHDTEPDRYAVSDLNVRYR